MATKDSKVSHIGILARKMSKFEFSAIFDEFRPFLDMRSTAGRPTAVISLFLVENFQMSTSELEFAENTLVVEDFDLL